MKLFLTSPYIYPRNPNEEAGDKEIESSDREPVNIATMDMGAVIRKKMSEQGTTIAWLAQKVNCDRSNLRKHLYNTHIYPELLLKISIALRTDFFVYYSDYFRQVFEEENNIL